MQVTESNCTWASACALTRELNSEEEPENAANMQQKCPKSSHPLSATDRHGNNVKISMCEQRERL